MKKNLSSFKKIWYAISTIVYTYLIQLITVFISIILYLIISNQSTSINFSLLYKYTIIAITISIIPLSIYLYKKYQHKENKIKPLKVLSVIPLGVSISLFYNMLVFNFLENKNITDLNLFTIIIYTGLLGPIFEELIFRYISLKKAKEVYNEKTAILLITIIFALTHNGLINITYAFILGLVLAYIYKKEQNIIYPVTIHIVANLTSIFIKEYHLSLLIISFIILIIYYIYYRRAKH